MVYARRKIKRRRARVRWNRIQRIRYYRGLCRVKPKKSRLSRINKRITRLSKKINSDLMQNYGKDDIEILAPLGAPPYMENDILWQRNFLIPTFNFGQVETGSGKEYRYTSGFNNSMIASSIDLAKPTMKGNSIRIKNCKLQFDLWLNNAVNVGATIRLRIMVGYFVTEDANTEQNIIGSVTSEGNKHYSFLESLRQTTCPTTIQKDPNSTGYTSVVDRIYYITKHKNRLHIEVDKLFHGWTMKYFAGSVNSSYAYPQYNLCAAVIVDWPPYLYDSKNKISGLFQSNLYYYDC